MKIYIDNRTSCKIKGAGTASDHDVRLIIQPTKRDEFAVIASVSGNGNAIASALTKTVLTFPNVLGEDYFADLRSETPTLIVRIPAGYDVKALNSAILNLEGPQPTEEEEVPKPKKRTSRKKKATD